MIAIILTVVVAALHVWFMALEMVFWDKPLGRRTFGTTQDFAAASKALALNQGLYNGFLVAGLIWGLWLGQPGGVPVLTFFFACVIVAGVVGALSVSIRILFVQALPAMLALAALRSGI